MASSFFFQISTVHIGLANIENAVTCAMSSVPSPINPQFATVKEAAAYDCWFRSQVQEAIEDTRPSVPHDKVMAEMRAIIASKNKSQVE